jgi:hypothetical protein
VFKQTNIENLQIHLIRLEILKARMESRKIMYDGKASYSLQTMRLDGILDEINEMLSETKQALGFA